jgi:hypothetical protein
VIEASCHCGAIRITCDGAPAEVTDCNCTLCRRYGVLWAYYSPAEVHLHPLEGATEIYLRGERSKEFHRCKVCGNVTHWRAIDRGLDRMGVNARLMDPDVVTSARTRFLDGAVTEAYVND